MSSSGRSPKLEFRRSGGFQTLAPILVRLDAVGDRTTIKRQYGRVGKLLLAMAIPGGLAYALLGPWITMLWLGAEHAPHDPFGFALAGAEIVWSDSRVCRLCFPLRSRACGFGTGFHLLKWPRGLD